MKKTFLSAVILSGIVFSSPAISQNQLGGFVDRQSAQQTISNGQFIDSTGQLGAFLSPDACTNIPGYQGVVPTGYTQSGGICVAPVVPVAPPPFDFNQYDRKYIHLSSAYNNWPRFDQTIRFSIESGVLNLYFSSWYHWMDNPAISVFPSKLLTNGVTDLKLQCFNLVDRYSCHTSTNIANNIASVEISKSNGAVRAWVYQTINTSAHQTLSNVYLVSQLCSLRNGMNDLAMGQFLNWSEVRNGTQVNTPIGVGEVYSFLPCKP